MSGPRLSTGEITVELLTRRESEVLRLLAQGLSDREIADRLVLSVNSVKWHARRIYEKLGVGSRKEAVKKAQEIGLLYGQPRKPAPRHSLPRALTKLVGRKVEITEVVELVWKHSLVTLTGSGGVGKTRLALAAAQELVDDFQDGVTYVDLSAVENSTLVLHSIMASLRVTSEANLDPIDSLTIYLNEREVLLVLNNCEHLAENCAKLVSTLLSRLDRLKVLATSREPIRVEGEVLYRVPSLAYPEADHPRTVEELAGFDSIALFVERAQDVLPGFCLDETNQAAVERICRRLDGIPLAIELAASRCASLGVAQVADQLEHSFHLLTGGTRMALERHRTLRSTIEWSYHLITEPERLLLRRLGVFVGGWVLPAAEQVCVGEGIAKEEVANLLGQLVDKSLVQADRLAENEPRYHMLATMQQFALEALYRSGESERLRKQHYEWAARMAAEAGPDLMTGKRLGWVKRLRPEHRNTYAALQWAIEEGNDLAGGLEILFQLYCYYMYEQSKMDFYPMLQNANLSMGPMIGTQPKLRALLLFFIANFKGLDYIDKYFFVLNRQALAASENLSSKDCLIRALILYNLGVWAANIESNLEQGYSMLLEAEEILRPRAAEYPWYLGWLLDGKAWVLRFMGKNAEAESCCEEAIQLLLSTGDVWTTPAGGVYWEMAEHAYRTGNYELAETYYEIEKGHCIESGNLRVIAHIDRIKANWKREHGCFREAWELYQSTLAVFDRMVMISSACIDINGMAANLSALAETQSPEDAWQTWMRAVTIMGALADVYTESNTTTCFEDKIIYDKALNKVQNGLSPEDFEKAWAEGLAMHYKQLVAYVQQIQVP